MKKNFIFIFFCLAFGFAAKANDTITFTWKMYQEGDTILSGEIGIRATDGKTFTVNWDDDSVSVYTGIADSTITISHAYHDLTERTVTITGNTTDCFFTHLETRYQQITKLDIHEAKSLIYLSCFMNRLTHLDVSENTMLQILECSYNRLTSLDVSNNTALLGLFCSYNQLTSLDVSHNTMLTRLFCSLNQLKTLDVSNNIALEALICDQNKLPDLDVSKNISLTNLHCFSNRLGNLDISNNTALINLYCFSNGLTNLDISNNTALTILYCYSNQLENLDISENKVLKSLMCNDNWISLANLYTISQQLDDSVFISLGSQRSFDGSLKNTELVYDSVFNGVGTICHISSNFPAVYGKDYDTSGGKITFKTNGYYTLSIKNDAIRTSGSTTLVTMTFSIYGSAVTAQANNSDYGTVEGSGTYYTNTTSATLTASANQGYKFKNWTSNNVVISIVNPLTFVVTQDSNIVANFVLDTFNVSTTATNGSVSGSGKYAYNSQATLVATANKNYKFKNWTSNGLIISTNNPFTFNVVKDTNIAAYFERKSSDAALKELSVSTGTLSPAFSSNHYNYTVDVNNNISNIEITAVANHDSAIVDGAGLKNLTVGNNVFMITVTAEDSTQKTYTVTINRAEPTNISQGKELPSLTFFPNPAKDKITIQLATPTEYIQITNLQGQVVLKESAKELTFKEIDVAHLAAGIYIISVFDGKQTVNKKLQILK